MTGDNAVYGMEETAKEGTVIEEKPPELFINGKNTMTVGDIEQLKGHGSSTLHCVGISAGRAEAAMAAKRNKFELSTEGTAIHSPTKGRVTLEFPLIRIFSKEYIKLEEDKKFFQEIVGSTPCPLLVGFLPAYAESDMKFNGQDETAS